MTTPFPSRKKTAGQALLKRGGGLSGMIVRSFIDHPLPPPQKRRGLDWNDCEDFIDHPLSLPQKNCGTGSPQKRKGLDWNDCERCEIF
jgi:hypothetical protein